MFAIVLGAVGRGRHGGAMLPNLDQLWYVEAEGYIVIDLTDALVNGHDVLNWTRPTTNS